MNKIRLEILESSYWEHFKYAKDLASYLPITHPKRKLIEAELNNQITELHNLKEKIKLEKETKKYLIIGSARHGKDTLAELLNKDFGLKFESSSQVAADIFLFDALKEQYGYRSSEECFEDRVNHRAEWYQLICEYNKEDRARLAKGILERTDCYVGMRDRNEIDECRRQKLFDLIIWVDASERLPLESPDSFNIDKSCADISIENNGTFEEFKEKISRIGKVFF